MSPDDSQPQGEVARRVEQISEQYLEKIQSGDNVRIADWVARYPDLAPFLETRLKLIDSLHAALRQRGEAIEGSSQAATATEKFGEEIKPRVEGKTEYATVEALHRDTVHRLRCPHCGNGIQLVSVTADEVICKSCGSSIRVTPDQIGTDLGPTKRGASRKSRKKLPERIGRFPINRLLGEGTFGTVYLAWDAKLEIEVAIKVPRHGYFATTDEERRFLREAKNTARLRHSNIVRVHEIGNHGDVPFIVSEYIDGLTLSDLIRSHSLSYQDIAGKMILIAGAVSHAHSRGIIHRDLKPSNILMDKDQNPYVADFGLARREDAEFSMTLDEVLLGTPAYMSPEQAKGYQRDVGPLSDIYSLGVILYQMLTRELPFHGSKRMLILQVLRDEPPSPRRFNDAIPRDLENITLKAMEKNPQKRYRSADEFSEDLQRWLRGDPVRARPISKLNRIVRWCSQHPTTASLSASVLVLLLLLASLSSLAWIRESGLRAIAQNRQMESESRHHDLLVQNATNALSNNDLTRAAFWISKALKMRDDSNQRMELALIQDQLPALTRLLVFDGPVSHLHYSEDGNRLICASASGHLSVFAENTKEPTFDKATDRFNNLSASVDGRFVALSGIGSQVQLFDTHSSQKTWMISHLAAVHSTDFSRDGKLLVTGSADCFVRLWRTADGSRLQEHIFADNEVNRVRFLPDQTKVILVTKNRESSDNEIQVWNYEDDQVVAKGMKHDQHVMFLDYAVDGTEILSVSTDGVVKQWDTNTGNLKSSLKLPYTPIRVYADFVHQRLVTTSSSYDTHQWDLAAGNRLGAEIRGNGTFTCAAITSNQRLIAVGSADGTVKVDWTEGIPACGLLRNGQRVESVAFHPNNRLLAVGGADGVIQFWDLAGALTKCRILAHDSPVRKAVFLGNDNRVFTVASNGQGFIWDAATGMSVGTPLEHAEAIYCSDESDFGRIIVTGGEDNLVKIWNGSDASPVGQPLMHSSAIMSIAISPDGKRIVSGCYDGTLYGWELAAANQPKPTPYLSQKLEGRVNAVAIEPSRELIGCASDDASVRCFDLNTGLLKIGPLQHPASAKSVAFLQKGTRMITRCANGNAVLWDLTTEKQIQQFDGITDIFRIQSHLDGKWLVMNEFRGRTTVWQLSGDEYELHHQFLSPAIETISSSSFDPLQSILAVGGGSIGRSTTERQSGSVAFWDNAKNRFLGPPLRQDAAVNQVALDIDGTRLLAAVNSNSARLWQRPQLELSLDDAERFFSLIAQVEQDKEGRSQPMIPATQIKLFDEMTGKYPNLFECDSETVSQWKAMASQQSESSTREIGN